MLSSRLLNWMLGTSTWRLNLLQNCCLSKSIARDVPLVIIALFMITRDMPLQNFAGRSHTKKAGTGASEMVCMWLGGVMEWRHQVSRPHTSAQTKPHLGCESLLHDRLHSPHRLHALCCHHAAAAWVGRVSSKASAQLPWLPLVPSYRGAIQRHLPSATPTSWQRRL
jgi:hypothetical protein